MKKYSIHRKDRACVNRKTKHRGALLLVLISRPAKRVNFETEKEFVAIKIQLEDLALIICCLYNHTKTR